MSHSTRANYCLECCSKRLSVLTREAEEEGLLRGSRAVIGGMREGVGASVSFMCL